MSISQKLSSQSSIGIATSQEASSDDETETLKSNRALMDQITLTRTIALQLSMRVMTIVASPSEVERARAIREYSEFQEQYLATVALLFGKTSLDTDLTAEKVEWIREIANQNENERSKFLTCSEKVKSTGLRLQSGDTLSFKDATQFYDSIFPATFDCMKQIIETLWEDLDIKKGDIEGARQTLVSAFSEIRKISTSVRLTAINASVEAARAGDAGRGFSVIASEVKSHAEGIQTATINAQNVINTIIH